MLEDYITYRIELGFAGFVGATKELEVDAPADMSKDDLMEYIRTEYDYDLLDMLSVPEITNLGDGEWEVIISFGDYDGVYATYSVYADDAEEAEELAQEEALWDFLIDYYEPVED